jgi:TPP-dependent pyruvate/acetoin dehydrogenase alpha subunit
VDIKDIGIGLYYKVMKVKKLIRFYSKISLIRQIELEISRKYPENKMRCPVHLSIGQESCAVGICENLKKKDNLYSTHRSHAHYIAKGGSLKKMIAEIYGKKDGCCKGRGGSMHLFDDSVGMKCSIPIVGSSICIAAGNALAMKLKKNNNKNIAVVIFGDGAIEEGIFYETLNFSIIKKLPILFVCENNLYSIMTHIKERQPKNFIRNINKLYQIPFVECDGNKIDEVYLKSQNLIKNIRNKKGPGFLLLNTYRYKEHCGPNDDLHLGYRSKIEFKKWVKKDPLQYCKKLISKSLKSYENLITRIDKKNKKLCDSAFEFAERSPLPSPTNIKNKVYSQ